MGKFSVEKIEELGPCWAKMVDLKHPRINFAASAGFLGKKSLEKEAELKKVDLGGPKQSQRASVMVQTLTLTLNSRGAMMSQCEYLERAHWGLRGLLSQERAFHQDPAGRL